MSNTHVLYVLTIITFDSMKTVKVPRHHRSTLLSGTKGLAWSDECSLGVVGRRKEFFLSVLPYLSRLRPRPSLSWRRPFHFLCSGLVFLFCVAHGPNRKKGKCLLHKRQTAHQITTCNIFLLLRLVETTTRECSARVIRERPWLVLECKYVGVLPHYPHYRQVSFICRLSMVNHLRQTFPPRKKRAPNFHTFREIS